MMYADGALFGILYSVVVVAAIVRWVPKKLNQSLLGLTLAAIAAWLWQHMVIVWH